jgi:hypothetical protein
VDVVGSYVSRSRSVAMIPYQVVIRKSDAQLGVFLESTWLGDIFFFDDFEDTEVLNTRYCVFLSDENMSKDEFIFIGEL